MTADASTKRQILTRKVERIATLCHPRTRKEKGRWWTAALLLITCLVVGVVLGIYWSRAPCPFDVRAQAEPLADHDSSRVVTGIVTTATAIHIGETLPDKPGGDLSNHVSPPGVFLDNTRNWELGALTAWRDLRTTLRNDFSRAQTQSVEDKDLAIAQPQSNYQSDSWMRPSTESEYRTGIDALDRYSEDLADNRATHAQFFARADNLAFYLEVVQKRLGILAQRLSYAVGQVRLDTALACDPSARQSTSVSAQTQTKTPWMKIDDIFFDARGYTWALLETLHGMEIDFAPCSRTRMPWSPWSGSPARGITPRTASGVR